MYRCGSGLQAKELAEPHASANSVCSAVWNRGFVKHPRAVKRRMGELAVRTLRRRLLLLLRQACIPSLEIAGVVSAEQAVTRAETTRETGSCYEADGQSRYVPGADRGMASSSWPYC